MKRGPLTRSRRRRVLHLTLLVSLCAPSLCYLVQNGRQACGTSCLKSASASSSSSSSAEEESSHISFTSSSFGSPMYDDQRPRRVHNALADERRKATNRWNDWGIAVKENDEVPSSFPSTMEAVVDAAHEAIAGVLHGREKNDPNTVQNIFEGDSVLGRRPVRRPWDAGRIGIELDQVSLLRSPSSTGIVTEGSALRQFAIGLAVKLAQSSWPGYEKTTAKARPVAIFFNTIRQALMASEELRLLKRVSNDTHTSQSHLYEGITVKCLGQDCEIPESISAPRRETVADKNRLVDGAVDLNRGMILIVQPTDFNDEYRPPGPSVGTVEALQRLIARAALDEVASVLISPRFATMERGWEQSGYQQSSSYGGTEPPRGPTPWVMRDFTPPVFSWIGKALTLPASSTYQYNDRSGKRCRYEGVGLCQSIMHEGHSWHLFASKRCSASSLLEYEYIASTKSAAGRPTRDLLLRVFSEFASYA